ncbi:hypothetical protein FQZ97_1018990 [compost metagenome]
MSIKMRFNRMRCVWRRSACRLNAQAGALWNLRAHVPIAASNGEGAIALGGMPLAFGGSSRLLGKDQPEARSAAWRGQNADLRAVALNDLENKVQAETSAAIARLQPVKRFEYAFPLGFRNAGPVIADLDHPVACDPDDDRSLISGMLDRILDQIGDGA